MKKELYIGSLLLILLYGIMSAQTNRNYTVIMRSNVGSATMWDGQVVRIFGFAPTLSAQPTLPGRTLYAEEGDSMLVTAYNISQGHDHTIHMHGMDANTKNDGDPLVSHFIGHGKNYTYRIHAKHAGTYLYHCHIEDVVHVQMGMYGLVVVKAAGGAKTAWTGGPPFDRYYNWLLSELDKSWHDSVPERIDDTLKIPPYLPDYFLINGKSEQQILSDDSVRISGAQGEYIYMRLANIGYFNNRVIFPSALNATVIDSDGRPLPNSLLTDTVMIMPGERYGVMLHPTTQFTDTVYVSYISMNTDSVWNTQAVPVEISGFFGINEMSGNSSISIYPNPASSHLEISYQNKGKKFPVEYFLINSLGQLALEGKEENNPGSFSIGISSLKDGLYFLKIKAGEEFLYQKVVIAK